MPAPLPPRTPPVERDVVVVGAGIGGIYSLHRFEQLGLSVMGIEGASDVGGVWYHNRYPGARVDLEGLYYCYFDPELYRAWQWTERYPGQPELLAYLNFAADRWDVRRHIRFQTWVTSCRWDPAADRWTVETDTGLTVSTRYLVMATGPLSAARKPDFPGLEDFRGQWVQTAHWPQEPVEVRGRRVGVVGTGSTAVQAIPLLAEQADHLYVFQRTAHYSVPAQNGPLDPARRDAHVARAEGLWDEIVQHPGGTDIPLGRGLAGELDPEERAALLEERWAYGGHTMGAVFTDQGIDEDSNRVVAEFVRDKIRATVRRPEVAEKLLPHTYPLGMRRLCVDSGYYETFNRPNVTLVDLTENPIERITETGVRTTDGDIEVDLLVFALGFHAITGALYGAGIHDGEGRPLQERWARGPRAYLGLMTAGFPNLFLLTGPGSPSVLANMFAGNEHHAKLVGDLIVHARENGHTRIEATAEAEQEWLDELARLSAPMLRLRYDNYMVHINRDDGSRQFVPYPGGFDRYVRTCAEMAADGFRGFRFACGPASVVPGARRGDQPLGASA